MGRRKMRGQRVSPSRALADLNVVLGETAEYRVARSEILMRFARVADGKPVLCAPPIEELRMGHVPGAFKVVYDTEQQARDAAAQLARLGSPPQRAYDNCPYGDHHFHLCTVEAYASEKKRSQ